MDHEAALLRAARAALGLEQSEVMAGAGIGDGTLRAAEQGERLSEKTWVALTSYYASQGVHVGDVGSRAVLLIE